MGLFDFLRKGNKTTKGDAILIEGDQRVNVVGESQYQDALAVLANAPVGKHRQTDITAALVPEPTNRHDPNAIQVQADGGLLGYLSRSDAVAYRPLLSRYAKQKQFVACSGIIVGGREEGHSYGVILFLPEP